jgi:hypothetical protein
MRNGGGVFIGALCGRGVKDNEQIRGDPTVIAPGTCRVCRGFSRRDDKWGRLVSGKRRGGGYRFGMEGKWVMGRFGT